CPSRRRAASPSRCRTWWSSWHCPAGIAPSWSGPTRSTTTCGCWPNRQARQRDSVPEPRVHLAGGPQPRTHGAVEETGPLVGGFGAGPEDRSDGPAQPGPDAAPRPWRHRGGGPSRRELLGAPTVVEVVQRSPGRFAEQRREPVERVLAALF